jgi:predicted MFS family arabinose efflux permease
VISNLAVAFAPGFVPLVLARLVLGVAVGGFWGLSASLALRLIPAADLPMALSIIFGGGAVAGVAAAPLGAFLGGQIGWRGVFVAAAGLAAVALATQFHTVPRMPALQATPLSGLWRYPPTYEGDGPPVRYAAGANFFADALQPADAATILEQLPSRRR